MILGSRFQEALVWAAQLHATQMRKASATPYVAHLLAVTAIVLEHGGTEDEAIAALLHDAIEDQGGDATRVAIRERFGERVAEIVEGCTDTDVEPKPPWRARKQAYIDHLPTCSSGALLVSAADKLHNARSIVMDLRRLGADVWSRFRGGRDGTLWYYDTLTALYGGRVPSALHAELERTVQEMHRLAETR